MGQAPVSKTELDKAKAWFDENQAQFPPEIGDLFKRILAVYLSFNHSAGRAKQTLQALRRALGFLPKSERGASDQAKTPDPLPIEEPLDPDQKAAYEALKAKRDELIARKREYDRDLARLKPRERSLQCELPLERPFEMQFSYPYSERKREAQKQIVDRMSEFRKTAGLHVSYDVTKRVDIQVVVTDITYKVETVTDPETGKSVRASMDEVGPEGYQVTWRTIGHLIKTHVGFAIPINRMVMMIGQPEFSSSKICRIMEFSADFLLPIYLCLFDELAEVIFFCGDDTGTKIIETNENVDADSISRRLDERFGWTSPRADGNGNKKAINVSLLIGRTEDDPRSTIRFFRTHVGSVGNLMDKILESRSPKRKDLTFQGDLSSANLARDPEVLKLFNIFIAGCMSHARRPFWRLREDDISLCYYMLKGFLKLSDLEDRIDALGRTRTNVLKYRLRYGRLYWLAMKNRCIAAVTGEVPGFATYPKPIRPNVWPPESDLYKACMYVINHFEELTLYLKTPELAPSNNGSERALRIEKSMLDSSKFRKTRDGRARLDILRTINATCTAARLDLPIYMRHCYIHRHELLLHPERFTPYAVARRLEEEKAGNQTEIKT